MIKRFSIGKNGFIPDPKGRYDSQGNLIKEINFINGLPNPDSVVGGSEIMNNFIYKKERPSNMFGTNQLRIELPLSLNRRR